ncbi:MAG: hypothetical protein ACK4ZD_05970 [Caldimonas sp.]|jgi:hypothetical protein|uniref:hypothetical protein n=1 Tax=Caldimonas sp. TaxID=2838790 RepID=UPI00391D1050
MIARVLSSLMLTLPLMLGAAGAWAQPSPALSDHVKKDIERHRAMAAAHEAAARCLESGKSEDACLKELQAACKGLGIGKHCGMRHVH